MATQDEYIKTALRLPRELHARIQKSAEQTGKSMNAELIARLQHSFDQHEIHTHVDFLNDLRHPTLGLPAGTPVKEIFEKLDLIEQANQERSAKQWEAVLKKLAELEEEIAGKKTARSSKNPKKP